VCPRCATANAYIMLVVPCVVQDWEKIYSDTMAIDSMRVIGRRVSSTNVGIHTFSAESLIAHKIGAANKITKRLVITLITDQWINVAAG